MPKKKPGKAEIVGNRIYLRPLESGDVEEFIALNRASKRLHRGRVSPPTGPIDFHKLLERCGRPDMRCLVICRIDDEAIVGMINLSQIFRGGFQSAYLGYYIGAEFARQGYTTEAVELILEYAFQRLRLHRLEANIQPGNRGSIAIVKRAGFVREGFSERYLKVCGRWRDHERWAIIAEQWRARRRLQAAK
jgi:[ribosomal protein S5]-alanine N-acetyltransferase